MKGQTDQDEVHTVELMIPIGTISETIDIKVIPRVLEIIYTYPENLSYFSLFEIITHGYIYEES